MARLGLALGAGAARGLAHIPLLEVFDELGLKPSIIAGSSMGSLVGAAYASGLSARDIRAHAEQVLSNRLEATKRIFRSRKVNPLDLVNWRWFSSVMIDGSGLTELVLPDGVASRVEETQIPLRIIATDFYEAAEVTFSSGPLAQAVAASIAIPGLIEAPAISGRVLIDGGMTNAVPFDHVIPHCDICVAIDVIGRPVRRKNGKPPSNSELAIGALQIAQSRVAQLKRSAEPPDIYIIPDLGRLRSHEFFKVQDFISAASKHKDDLKRQLDTHFSEEL